jgi:hypothetical protein
MVYEAAAAVAARDQSQLRSREQAWRKKPPAATAARGGREGGDAVRRSRDPQEGPPAPQGVSVVGEEVNGTCALDA